MTAPAAMGDLIEYRPPQEPKETTASIGMVIFLASWLMMFAALFFVYGAIRARATAWPPPNLPVIPLLMPTINTLVIALSSVVMHSGIVAMRRGKTALVAPSLLVTLVLGTVFMALQIVVWTDLYNGGLLPSNDRYGAVFYMMTGVHAAHVIVGLGALLWLTIRAFTGHYTPARYLSIRLWAMYWHFVGVVWLAVFGTVYFV